MKTFQIVSLILALLIYELEARATSDENKLNDFLVKPRTGIKFDIQAKINKELNDNNDSLSQFLKKYGISIDADSKYQIHDEKSFIDFSCFNCIINDISGHKETDGPDNAGGGGWSPL